MQEDIMESIEITILSAENLRDGKKPVKRSTFVAVRTGSDPDPGKCSTTKMSPEGGSYHTWGDKVVLDRQAMQAGFFTLEVHRPTSAAKGRSKIVGGARVPVSDFLWGYVPANHLQFLSYRLWDYAACERNGVINISVRVTSPTEPFRRPEPPKKPNTVVVVPSREKERVGGGVVTGVPAVWIGRSRCTY
ncbi:hypothetical protein SAY86_011207 [Trapa natans]|uniref:C2 domain-containing protein n=1 Tax=Trapa natans TaxID=22666 RepID=A0AAN7LLS1_TRANT|nr:hypothetical protein SAY86_011207 [Trapa natans]